MTPARRHCSSIAALSLSLSKTTHGTDWPVQPFRRDTGAVIRVFSGRQGESVLLARRFVPQGAAVCSEPDVFLYHDGEDCLIANTLLPEGMPGEIVRLPVVTVLTQGTFYSVCYWG